MKTDLTRTNGTLKIKSKVQERALKKFSKICHYCYLVGFIFKSKLFLGFLF